MYEETFTCACKGCNLRKVRMLFEMHKSQTFYGRDCYQRCNAMIVSSLCLERECIDYPKSVNPDYQVIVFWASA